MRDDDEQLPSHPSDLTIWTTQHDSSSAERGEAEAHGDDETRHQDGVDPQSEHESGEVVGWFGLVPSRWREVIGLRLDADVLLLLTLRVGALVSADEVNSLEKRYACSSTRRSSWPETSAARGRIG
ncbi:MAG: hypothetical protein M3322_00565 [Actinomycetota bacterium]|nr:hypothetical protein [Actinomycetota bacterium]